MTPTTPLNISPLADAGDALAGKGAGELNKLDLAIASIVENTPVDEVCDLIGKVDFMKGAIRALDAALKERLIEYIDANGEFCIGDVRYYVGIEKDVNPRSDVALFEALLDHCGGDPFTVLQRFMSSNWFKQGQVKKDLGDERHAQLFETVEKKDLKTGKPKRSVQKVDPKFIR